MQLVPRTGTIICSQLCSQAQNLRFVLLCDVTNIIPDVGPWLSSSTSSSCLPACRSACPLQICKTALDVLPHLVWMEGCKQQCRKTRLDPTQAKQRQQRSRPNLHSTCKCWTDKNGYNEMSATESRRFWYFCLFFHMFVVEARAPHLRSSFNKSLSQDRRPYQSIVKGYIRMYLRTHQSEDEITENSSISCAVIHYRNVCENELNGIN